MKITTQKGAFGFGALIQKTLNHLNKNKLELASVEEAYFDKYDKPYQREKLEKTPEERQLERPKYIERNLLVTEAEDLLRHGYRHDVEEILEDGEVVIRSDLNCRGPLGWRLQ